MTTAASCNSAPQPCVAGDARGFLRWRSRFRRSLRWLFVPMLKEPEQGPQVAAAVRDLRHVRNLSQRQLAARMNVPRTYISKIENGKAMPTLSSLDRLAKALEVDISALLRDASTRHCNETALLMNDPFLAEIAAYTSQLDSLQRSIFLNHVRELAAGRRRTA